MGALTLSLLSIPAWAFGGTAFVLVLGAVLMQADAASAVCTATTLRISRRAIRV
jgi:hypothetical protein